MSVVVVVVVVVVIIIILVFYADFVVMMLCFLSGGQVPEHIYTLCGLSQKICKTAVFEKHGSKGTNL